MTKKRRRFVKINRRIILTKRRFAKIKRRFILTKRRFTTTNRRFIFSRQTVAKTHLKNQQNITESSRSQSRSQGTHTTLWKNVLSKALSKVCIHILISHQSIIIL